jgi:hypothetical protein
MNEGLGFDFFDISIERGSIKTAIKALFETPWLNNG